MRRATPTGFTPRAPSRGVFVARLLTLLLLPLLVTAGCSRAPESYQERIYIFGTLVDVTLSGVEETRAREAVAAVARDFQREHYEWHAWRPGALTELNAAIARGEPHAVPDTLLPLLLQSRDLYRASHGLFNPAIGGLLALWGFQADEPPHGPPPAKEAIARWVDSAPGMEDLEFDGTRVHSRNPAVRLDLGGFAKGYAVDLAIDKLKGFGIENAIVNAGGDLRAIGSKGGRPWRVGVRHPQGEGVLAAIEVSGDESVFTSGNYERYNEHEGVRYAHILDPRTGMPVQGVTSVTVIHDNGAEADAAATALVVAGVEGWHATARAMGIRYAMLVDDSGTVHLNPAMRERVTFTGTTPPLALSPPLR